MNIRAAQPGDAAGIARVHVDSWRTTYPGILPAEVLASLSYQRRETAWAELLAHREGVNLVAEAPSGQIVGFASGGPNREDHPQFAGELYAIYLLATAQGKGVGRRLTHETMAWLAEHGMHSMLVWVAAANPSRRFYESLGGQFVGSRIAVVAGVEIEEASYGWADTALILKEL